VAERSSLSQAVQLGVESTPGTAVAATKRLGSIGFELGVQAEINTRRPIGQKYPNISVLGKEWGEADISGAPVYTELPYVYSSLISTPTVTQIMDAAIPTAAWRWVFQSSTFDADAPKTFTIEQGDSVRAHRAAYGLITDMTMEWSREEITLDGTMLSKRIEDGITLSVGATALPQVPVRPTELSVYLDPTDSALGTTKLLRAISGEFSIESRFAPVWVVDAAQTSFVAHVESEPEVKFTLLQQANAQGMENLVRMRAGGTAFLRLHAVGPVIYTNGPLTVTHELKIDLAGQITEPESFSNEDDIYAVEWGFSTVYDPTWANAYRVEVITTTAAL